MGPRRKLGMNEVVNRVKKIVVEHLGADSLDAIELTMAFEDEFGVEIPDEQAETLLNVGDAVKFLEKALAQK
jgi:acyl carrier protein